MSRQISLGLFSKGIYVHSKGYLRYSSPKHLRGKYVHRVVIENLINETPYSVKLLLPEFFEVHHIDRDKKHNCPNNLLIPQTEIHSFLSNDGRIPSHGRKPPRAECYAEYNDNIPDWVNLDDMDNLAEG